MVESFANCEEQKSDYIYSLANVSTRRPQMSQHSSHPKENRDSEGKAKENGDEEERH